MLQESKEAGYKENYLVKECQTSGLSEKSSLLMERHNKGSVELAKQTKRQENQVSEVRHYLSSSHSMQRILPAYLPVHRFSNTKLKHLEFFSLDLRGLSTLFLNAAAIFLGITKNILDCFVLHHSLLSPMNACGFLLGSTPQLASPLAPWGCSWFNTLGI